MGIVSRSLGVRAFSLEDPAQPLLPYSALFESLGLGRSDAGVMINERQAMRITTAQACTKIISEDLSTTSHEILQELPDGTVRRATEHRLWRILHDQPNPWMTAAVFWGAVVACKVGWGNGYAWIKRDNAARVVALILLHPGKTAAVKVGGQFKYATTQTDTGAPAYFDPENILHFKGLTLDGITGLSPVQECKNAFGLASAAEKFGAQFFGSGARATGVLTHPEVLEGEAYENLKKSLRELATGETALRPILLEEGMTWTQLSVNPSDAQFLGVRQFQRSEIASLYRVAMHLLQDLQRATNNNIEHQSLDHVRYCLRPNAVHIEQEVNCKLLGGSYSMEHNLNDLQRGDFASQTAGYTALRNIGVYSTDDILRAMRQNPIGPAAGGDIRIVQGAMIPLTALLPGGAAAEGDDSTDSDLGDAQPFNRRFAAILPAYRKLMRDAVGRAINRGADGDFVRRAFQPAVASMAQALVALRFGYSELTHHEVAAIERETRNIVESAPNWDAKDASAIATRVTNQVFNALSGEVCN